MTLSRASSPLRCAPIRTQCARIEPLRELVENPATHAFAHLGAVDAPLADVEALLGGDLRNCSEQGPDLPSPCACSPSRRQASSEYLAGRHSRQAA